jgi:hypothetical protein
VIPRDKLAHFYAGIAVAALAYPFGASATITAVALAAVGKELWDAQGNGTSEVWDAIATLLGGVALLGWYALPLTGA